MDEALGKIRQMSVAEKIAALTPIDKAFIRGYVERAIRGNSKNKRRNQKELCPNDNTAFSPLWKDAR